MSKTHVKSFNQKGGITAATIGEDKSRIKKRIEELETNLDNRQNRIRRIELEIQNLQQQLQIEARGAISEQGAILELSNLIGEGSETKRRLKSKVKRNE